MERLRFIPTDVRVLSVAFFFYVPGLLGSDADAFMPYVLYRRPAVLNDKAMSGLLL